MPERKTMARARRDRREGKSASTQAGEFVREEIHHIREGKHGARLAKQAIAIGLSKARRAGVELPPPRKGPKKMRRAAKAAYDAGHGHPHGTSSPRRAGATMRALRREGTAAAGHTALSRHARGAARARTASERSRAARAGARTRASTAGGRGAQSRRSRR